MGRLNDFVRDFGRRVRASPSLSVGPELDRLIAAADREDEASVSAKKSPIANLTWMQRGILPRDQLVSPQLPMEIPFACKIVTCKVVTILAEGPGDGIDFIEAPLSAIDVVMTLNRAEVFTARQDKLTTLNQDAMVVSLAAFNDDVRSFELALNADDNIMSVQFKWALPLDIVAAYAWGNLQISMNWAVDPIVKYGETGRYAKPV